MSETITQDTKATFAILADGSLYSTAASFNSNKVKFNSMTRFSNWRISDIFNNFSRFDGSSYGPSLGGGGSDTPDVPDSTLGIVFAEDEYPSIDYNEAGIVTVSDNEICQIGTDAPCIDVYGNTIIFNTSQGSIMPFTITILNAADPFVFSFDPSFGAAEQSILINGIPVNSEPVQGQKWKVFTDTYQGIPAIILSCNDTIVGAIRNTSEGLYQVQIQFGLA